MTEASHEETDPQSAQVGLMIAGNWMMGCHYAVTVHFLTVLMVVVDNGERLMSVLTIGRYVLLLV